MPRSWCARQDMRSEQHKLKQSLTRRGLAKLQLGETSFGPRKGRHKARGMKEGKSGEQATCPGVASTEHICSMIKRIHFDIDNVKRASYAHKLAACGSQFMHQLVYQSRLYSRQNLRSQ